MNTQLQTLIEQGIPLAKAQFQAAVNSADQVPENYFLNDHKTRSRRAQMWGHPSWTFILVCQKNLKDHEVFFFIPNANVIYANFVANETDILETEQKEPKRRPGRPKQAEA